MDSINKNGDETARYSKYNDYQISDMLKRRQQMLIDFRKWKKHG